MKMYPHELSGGMKQRVIVAMAITLRPTLVIADEPVTALDIVMLRTVLETLASLKERYGMTVTLVAHDMAVHAEIVDRLAIMYAGKVVKIGSVYDVFYDSLHSYIKGLISAIPTLGEKRLIKTIPGIALSPLN